ncbi:hypothetical protein BV898_15444 [Hypsibius exemplaris]|uniref:Serpin domain-containing protein n=1 Tax=Hypsibius exemplaris TaxID=2072580 RepID=A0A9X6RK72_HYPEX|nr:hypothetical protein BV898_15444 [Hypsibius exemplaris]
MLHLINSTPDNRNIRTMIRFKNNLWESSSQMQGVTSFVVDLYKNAGQRFSQRSFAISPFCVEAALTLAFHGSDGQIRIELSEILRSSVASIAEFDHKVSTVRNSVHLHPGHDQWNILRRQLRPRSNQSQQCCTGL